MKRYNLWIGIFCLLLLSSAVYTQNVDQKPSLWLSAGWGGGDNLAAPDSYTILSLRTKFQFSKQLIILSGEHSRVSFFEQKPNYKLTLFKGLWAYTTSFENQMLYAAIGISYARHQKKVMQRDSGTPNLIIDYEGTSILGIPLEAGFNITIAKKIAVGSMAFININPGNWFIGYLVELQYKLF